LQINNGSLFVQDRSPQANTQTSPPLRLDSNTHEIDYFNIVEEDQAGACIVAHRGSDFQTFALKTRRVDGHQFANFKRTSHPNICNLADFFQPSLDSICLVYEDMAVSLAEIQSCPTATFKEYELAAIGLEVLQGLTYLENELDVGHGVTTDEILLSPEGAVKIGEQTLL
jgi:serine/threonine protein kinase